MVFKINLLDTVKDRAFIRQEKTGVDSVGILIGHSGHVVADHSEPLTFVFSILPLTSKTFREQAVCFFEQNLEDFHQHPMTPESCTLNGIALDDMPGN